MKRIVLISLGILSILAAGVYYWFWYRPAAINRANWTVVSVNSTAGSVTLGNGMVATDNGNNTYTTTAGQIINFDGSNS